MGGKQIKQSFFERVDNDSYRPFNFIRLSDEMGWLCGGSIPLFKESFEYLRNEDVGLIITTLIEPIRSGVNYNHVPFDFDEMSWVTSDDITQELKQFEVVHIPIVAAHAFYGENSNLLLKTIREYHINHPDKSIYIASWAGTDRSHFAMIYTLMKLYKMTFSDAFHLLREKIEKHDRLRLSDIQRSFLKGEQLSDLDIYNSRPEIRTPQDHKCYDKEAEEEEEEDPPKPYVIAKSEVRYKHINCAVCLHQCDDVCGEIFVEPIFRTLPEQIKETPIVFSNRGRKKELESVVPYMSQELGELCKLNKRYDMDQKVIPSKETIYNFALTFRSDHVPDMIAFVKRVGDYIVYFDRKGRGLMMDIGNEGGEVLELSSIYGSEGAPKNVFLYKDTAGDPILLGYRYDDYGIWGYKSPRQDRHWVTCHKDHNFKYAAKFKFHLTTTGRMVLVTPERSYYASFAPQQSHYEKYKLILDPIPKDDLPIHKVVESFVRVNSSKRYRIDKQLSIASVPKESLNKVAARGYVYDHTTGTSTQVKEYSLHSVFSFDKYDDIAIVGHDGGIITVWKSK